MVVLDSTFIIHFLKNKEHAVRKAREFSDEIATTQINVYELLVGIYSKEYEERQKELSVFNDFLGSITILEFDEKSAHCAARIAAQLNKAGQTVDSIDVIVAAIAISNGEKTIVTQNAKDFSKIPGLKVESY